jgi:hypothetical protein
MDWLTNKKDKLSQGRVLRKGINGWTCLPDIPEMPQHSPMCNDETMMKWLAAPLAGKAPDIDRVGLSYMLMGDARQGQGVEQLGTRADPREVKQWFYIGPMVMVVLPDTVKDALRGINQDLSNNEPYTRSAVPQMLRRHSGSFPLRKAATRSRNCQRSKA